MVFKDKKTKKLNSEDNNTKITEYETESEIDKTDFAKNTSYENKFNKKYSIRKKFKNTEKLNFGDNNND
jgi:hypothetical protein